MLNRIIVHGGLAGLIVGAVFFAFAVSGTLVHGAVGMAIGYLTMLVALSLVFVAIKRHRDLELGGVIRFWPAFALGLGVSIVASLIYALAWEASLAATGGAEAFVEHYIEQERARGAPPEALAEMEGFRAIYANPLLRMAITFTEIFPVGLLVSLLSAALLRNRRFLPVRRASPASADVGSAPPRS